MKRWIVDLVGFLTILLSMMIAAAPVALVIALARRLGFGEWYYGVVASPALYCLWLGGFLALSAATCRQMGRRHPKPRLAMVQRGTWEGSKDVRGFLTASVCYRRLGLLDSLPLVWFFAQFRYLDTLVLRAYAPSVHIGRFVLNMGRLYDPDLTEIDDYAVIGGRAVIVAHGMALRTDGTMVFVSAPVKIGTRATIGGEARVGMGCIVGADAIVEMGAVVEAFTRIPAGEVWGGSPARFRRRRDDIPGDAAGAVRDARSEPPPASNPIAAGVPYTPAAVPIASHESALRQLVVDALGLTPEQASGELTSETCDAWDSLGQVAIAAAIYDRYNVTVDANDLFRLRTLQDIAAVVFATAAPPLSNEPVTSTIVLPDDPEMLPLLDPQEVTQALSSRTEAPGDAAAPAEQLALLVAASFTAQPMATAVKVWARAFGIELDCDFAGYGQIVQTLMSGPARPLTLVLVRPEDLAPGIAEATDQLEEIVAAAAASPATVIVGTLPPAVSAFGTRDRSETDRLRQSFSRMLAARPELEIFDFAAVVEHLGSEQARSSQSEVYTRGPYSARLYQELGIALVRHLRARRRSPAKVLALDCDNTLWGGVVGEVGPDHLELGPDGRGRSFQLFQQRIKQLKDCGLLLVVVSRNEASDVRNMFESHPGTILKASDIAGWRVNWEAKSQNLRELAGELNLSPNAFVFLDDDPAVRMEVQTRLPDVHVVPLPADPAHFCETLERLWLFDGAAPTTVDAARTEMAQQEQRRQQELRSAPTVDEYLHGLNLRVSVRAALATDWPRLAQLTQRTNQFNLSLRRRTQEELKAAARDGHVLVAEAEDRFGTYGLVGVCVLTPRPAPRNCEPGVRSCEIDTLLMSCRALGRGVEDAFLHGIGMVAASGGAGALAAPFVPGPRNAQMTGFLARSGFSHVEDHLWTRLLDNPPALPVHVAFAFAAEAPSAVGTVEHQVLPS